MRNVRETAEQGRKKIHPRSDLTVAELNSLYECYRMKTEETHNHYDGLWEAIVTAFYFGYAVGERKRKAR